MEWWQEIAELHSHIKIHGLAAADIKITEEMLARFAEIEYMPEDFVEIYTNYVLTGETSAAAALPPTHPFSLLVARKNQVDQYKYLINLDFRQSLIEMGVDVNDI